MENNEKASETKTAIIDQLGENLANGTATPINVIFTDAPAPLDLYEETPVRLGGILENVAVWSEERKGDINAKESYLMVNRDKMTIDLVTDERNHFKNNIGGQLQYHPVFLLFGINGDKFITAEAMGDKIKMNRSFFENKTEAMALVSQMKNFVAKVDKDVEQKKGMGGDFKQLRAQVVTTNLPDAFKLKIPIFKGQKPKSFEVEIEIHPNDLTCRLVSPEANEEAEHLRDTAIDAVIERVKVVLPGIAVLEQ